MKFLSLLLTAAWLTLAATGVAHAGPLAAAVGVVAGIWTAIGPIAQLVVSVGLQIGVSLFQKAMQPSTAAAAPVGVSTTATFGDTTPIGFPIGATATAGTFIYGGEWGSSGDTPNAYTTDVYVLSDLPIAAKPGIWVNGQKCTVDWAASPTAQGYPVTDFRDAHGVDYMWVRYADGTQTAADSFLTTTFGADPNRPWKSTMIGTGVALVIVTALYNRNLFTSFPTYLFEPGESAWYDITKDTTAGGSGSHRWADPTTWEATSNPKVIAYNLMRGVYFGSEWVFGGQNLSAGRFPASSWIAAINACRSQVALAAGGTEDQFRCGMFITTDTEPLSVVEELDKASSAYTAEVGGKFKTIAGAPGSAVYSFTDADVLVTRDQTLQPFPAFSATYNVIQATYPEPAEQWQSKDAPDLEDSTLIAADAGFYLPTSAAFAAVPFALQVQRLMQTLLNVSRRFRLHTLYLPPDAWVLEPGVDIVSWTSAANGYTSETFLVTTRVGNPGYQQQVTLLELDPGADYAWTTADEKTVTTSFVGIVRPAAQTVNGWTVAPAQQEDDDGTARRPSIEVSFDGNQADVRATRITVRLKSSAAVVFDAEIPYGAPASGTKSYILNGTFLPDVTYQVQGTFVPYSGRAVTPSAWLDVLTPDVSVSVLDFSADVANMLAWGGSTAREVQLAIQNLALGIASQDYANYTDHQEIIRQLVSVTGDAVAQFNESILAATGPSSAIVQDITTLYTALGGNGGGVTVQFSSSFTPSSGWDQRFGFEAYDTIDGQFHAVGLFGEVKSGAGQLVLIGSQIKLAADSGAAYALFNSNGEVVNGTIRGPGTGNFWNLLTGAMRVSNS